MLISSGLFDHMVLQRGQDDCSDAQIAGASTVDGALQVSVSRDSKPLDGLAELEVGSVANGKFSIRLQGLPVGGPYDLELSATNGGERDSLLVQDVLVGDVWLLAGQSNMQGIGLLREAPESDPLVRAYFMDNRWDVAIPPLHNISAAAAPVHRELCGGELPPPNPVTGVGPGVAFGRAMLKRRGVPQGVIASAHGGTSMQQWDPSRRDEGDASLYGAMINRFQRNGSQVAGLVWYQGESDANAGAAPLYRERMLELIQAVRRDCGEDLPIAIVQISRVVGWGDGVAPFWDLVQEEERCLPESIDRLAVVPSIDLTLDDTIHISARGHRRLGQRLAGAMLNLIDGAEAAPPPIALGTVEHRTDPRLATTLIEVGFDNVQGALQSGDRPWGFSVQEGHGSGDHILDIRLDGAKAMIYTDLPGYGLDGFLLSYGRGVNPYCNITDAADRSVPVFGPLPLGKVRALTPFIHQFRVSEVLPAPEDFAALPYPDVEALQLAARDFGDNNLAGRHLELQQVGEEDAIVYYACTLDLSEPMELAGLLGYDGPAKVWVDGKDVFLDLDGTNPAAFDEGTFPITGEPGQHEILIALGANQGKAWGIGLRCQRLDVADEKIIEGAWAYALPAIEP